jgi:pyruvate dehydrogenase E1 component beta subunit
MQELSTHAAIECALAEEMRRDPTVILLGEGVATKRPALVAEFGADRVRNTPLAEAIIAGTAAGAAATGLRPVVDLLFAPFLTYAMDALVNSAGKLRFISDGQFSFPLVAIAMTGSGWAVGAQHNHNVEAWFAHSPGLKVVMPSTPSDFRGLLKAAIRDDNPVLFFIDLALLGAVEPALPGADVVPLGSAAVRRSGSDLTLVTYGKTVHTCLAAAERLAARGVDAEVIDLRTIKPLDASTVLRSVHRTGRLIAVHEASRTCGVGAELAALVSEHAFEALRAPIVRLTGPDAPAAASPTLEEAYAPSVDAIETAASKLMGTQATYA